MKRKRKLKIMRLTFKSNLADAYAEADKLESKPNVIPNIQIARIGEARGHKVVKTKSGFIAYDPAKHPAEAAMQVAIDSETLRSLVSCAGERVKCLMNHSDDINEVAGVFKNFRIDGDSVRADLHLLKHSKYHDYLLELSAECPEGFGVSINFYSTYGELEPINTKKTVSCICEKLVSCDLVTEPAATDGLFTVGEHTTQSNTTKMADENTDQQPASEEIAKIAATAAKEAVTEAMATVTDTMTKMSDRMTKLEEASTPPVEEKTEEEKLAEKEAKEKAETEKMSTLAATVAGAVITKLGVTNPVTPSVQNADDTTKLNFSEHVDHIVSTEGKNSIEATKEVMSKFPDKHKAHLASLKK